MANIRIQWANYSRTKVYIILERSDVEIKIIQAKDELKKLRNEIDTALEIIER